MFHMNADIAKYMIRMVSYLPIRSPRHEATLMGCVLHTVYMIRRAREHAARGQK